MPAPTPLLAASPNTAQTAVVVVPSDTVVQAVPFRALWVGVAGNVNIQFADGTNAVFVGVPIGMHPVGGVRVNAASTTATTMLAVY